MKPVYRQMITGALICLLGTVVSTACKHEPPVAPASSGDDDGGSDDDGGGIAPDTANVGF